jgi:DNA-binding transcriptional MerR regulator
MRIGEVAARSGVSVRSLRYYEEQQLLTATRSPSGQRHYDEAVVERVALIQLLYAAGLSSGTILDLLPCVDTGVSTDHSLGLLRAERSRIDARIGELTAARDKLGDVIAAAVGAAAAGSAGPCAATA